MSLGEFSASRSLTMGVELELQIVSRHDYDLSPCCADLLRYVERNKIQGDIKPEITDSMIEIATGICSDFDDARQQLRTLRDALVAGARTLNVDLCGGGTHAFQHWPERRIFDKPRFKELADLYGYLSKQFTIFGQHVHLGCSGADQALWLLHALSRYIPHFIALSASSPFVQGHDTGFDSARLNSVFAFPLSGRAPFVTHWEDFGTYFDKMTRTGVVKSMKDFYWDIRPKPEYGTIEVRVMDVPLTVDRAAALAAYIQALGRYLLVERPFQPHEDDYLVYTYNRFQACRFGLEGVFVDPKTGEHRLLHEDILATFEKIESHATELNGEEACIMLRDGVIARRTDASWLRARYEEEKLLPEVVRQACSLWQGSTASIA